MQGNVRGRMPLTCLVHAVGGMRKQVWKASPNAGDVATFSILGGS